MTKVYGTSDDLIEFEGDLYGEVGCFGTDDREQGILVIFSDGTLIEVKYGKGGMAVWGITVINQGYLFDKIEFCSNPDADIYSDIVYLKEGIKWGYAASSWGKVC